MTDIKKFLIGRESTVRDAMSAIQKNTLGVVCLVDESGGVVGVLSDGDTRRYLIGGGSISDLASGCATTDFVWGNVDSSRELLIKKLDSHIKVIPILDSKRQLVDLITKDHFPMPSEQPIYSRGVAPVRISFGGGGSDLTHYFSEVGGAVINAAISLYSHATLRLRDDERVLIQSRDLKAAIDETSLDVALSKDGKLGLIQALLRVIDPKFGFELYLHSDFPMGSGLGGSATLSAAILACFNQFRRDRWNHYEMAELAYQAERLMLRVSGGWQDQYASVFGGFNFIEFRMEKNIVHPLRIDQGVLSELEESLVLCNTKTTHDSGDIHDDQRKQMSRRDIKDLVRQNVEISYALRDFLLRGNLREFGLLLDKTWSIKKRFSEYISTEAIDKIYEGSKLNGASGGKLLGAGGGGFLMFFVPPEKKNHLMSYLDEEGLIVQPFRFEKAGVRAWTSREKILERKA